MEQLLTARERQVLDLISRDLSSREITDLLHISKHTITSHRKNLMHKLDAKNGAGLVTKGFELGYLSINLSHITNQNNCAPLRSVG